MDRNTFIKELGHASSVIDKRKIKKLIKRSVDSNLDNNPRGQEEIGRKSETSVRIISNLD